MQGYSKKQGRLLARGDPRRPANKPGFRFPVSSS